jgi:hypothetical protein
MWSTSNISPFGRKIIEVVVLLVLYMYGNIYNNIKYNILIDTHATRTAY